MLIKYKFYIIGAVLLIILGIWVNSLVVNNRKLRDDVYRLQQNQEALLLENKDNYQLELSFKEFKATMSTKIDSILKVAEIASKRVKTVTEIHNYYIDSSKTVINPPPVVSKIDTIYPFKDVKDCIMIEGYMKIVSDRPQLTITKRASDNEITLIGYWFRPHRFLFIKYGKKEYDIKVADKCGHSDVKKIEIVKRK